jgi:hypothetical protein
MRTQTGNRSTNANRAACWLPQPARQRVLDLSHWQSRAAHGHTWNARAAARPTQAFKRFT